MIEEKNEDKGIRVAKLIAMSGHCSRREAEALIVEGRVQVNGVVINSPTTFITDHSVKVDGKLISEKQPVRLWLFHKPKGVITTNKDPKNRKTVFDALPKGMPRVITVGRLDYNTEGLLLLTNDGTIARYAELPQNKWIRNYRARVFGKLDILVNNAGVGYIMEPFTEFKEASWDAVLGVNLKGAFLCSKHAALQMQRQQTGGSIVNISSLASKSWAPYATV